MSYYFYLIALCLSLLTPQSSAHLHPSPSAEQIALVVPEPNQQQDDLWIIQLIVGVWLGSGVVLLILGIALRIPVLWIIGAILLLLFLIPLLVIIIALSANERNRRRVVKQVE